VMLAASFFSLILPALDHAQAQGATKAGAAAIVVIGILLGAGVIWRLDAVAPSLDRFAPAAPGMPGERVRRVWLFTLAITLHNLPEGLAVGLSFSGGDMQAGISTAFGIGLQNMPEGLAVAASLASIGYSRRAALSWALASGLVEPVAGTIGAVAVQVFAPLLPWGFGFAAGAMIFVVVSEIIPDTNGRADGRGATLGLMIGLCVMLLLDVSLG
jgi:zinc transporter, ZIP family